MDQQVDRIVADRQTRDGQLAEPLGEGRALQLEPAGRCVRPQPEHRVQQVERRGSGPGLRRAGDGIRHRRADVLAGETAEQLGQAQVREPLRRFDQPAGQQVRAIGRAARLQTGGDQCVVMRPDRARVVADRVVADLARRERADPPAREHVRGEQALGHDRGSRVRDDAGPQRLARIRGDARDRTLVAVERHRIEARIRQPKGVVELLLQLCRSEIEPLGEGQIAAMAGKPGHRPVGREDVALHLGQRDRPDRGPAVEVTYRISRVLPALVEEPELGPTLIFDEAIAIEIA